MSGMDYALFDRRGYRTLGVEEGYGAWAPTYESVVQDEMDLRLLERVTGIDWTGPRVLDLACGTGRIGVWLRSRGAKALTGVDFTSAMLEGARAKAVYDRLDLADVTRTPLEAGAYDVIVQSLADEHMKELAPLYAETARLAAPGAAFVIVGFHPHFLMSVMPTHFDGPDGRPLAVESYVHLMADHVKAAHGAGWRLDAMEEGLIDEAWLAKKPKWAHLRHHPVSFLMVWRR